LVEKRNNVELLAAVDTPRQGDFGGMRVLPGLKWGNIQRSGAGLESGGKTALARVMGRPLLREDIQK